MDKKVSLSSPWSIYFRQVQALFKKDPSVQVELDYDTPELKIYVVGAEKADALTKLLPKKKEYGDVTLIIYVIPAIRIDEDLKDVFEKAFRGNEAFVDTVHLESFQQDYILFKKEVVQYFDDDLSDAHGICSTLYQDLAKDVFVDLGARVHFCTEYQK